MLAPQRGLTAIGHSQNPNTGDGVLQYPGNVKLWESPRQSRGFSPINNVDVGYVVETEQVAASGGGFPKYGGGD